jgi:hypothetical protein
MATVSIPLHSRKYPGLFAIIDAEDYERVSQYRWHPAKAKHTFYAATSIRKSCGGSTLLLLHRLITDAPKGVQVDHRDGNGLLCQKYNLRFATQEDNARNHRRRKGITSPYRGLSYDRRNKRWRAGIYYDGKTHHLGSSKDATHVAHLAHLYDRTAIKVFGEFARTNFDMQLPLLPD